MKIAVIDDYQDVFRSLKCFPKLAGQDVSVFQSPARNEAELVKQLSGAEAIILTMQRTALPRHVIEQLPDLCGYFKAASSGSWINVRLGDTYAHRT